MLAGDLDNDGWPDIYVANDSTASAMYRNQKNGTFKDVAMEAGGVLSPDGKPQAGMGVSVGDYNRDGNLDIVKTNFAGDTDFALPESRRLELRRLNLRRRPGREHPLPRLGRAASSTSTTMAGSTSSSATAMSIPRSSSSRPKPVIPQRKLLYKNGRNGRFHEVTDYGGPGILEPYPSRGCAFGDCDNDGDVDFVVNGVNSLPQLIRCDSRLDHNWIKVKCIGVKSNRSAIGARLKCVTQPPDEAQAASADRRGPQRRRLYLAKRPAHSLRHRQGRERSTCSKSAGPAARSTP